MSITGAWPLKRSPLSLRASPRSFRRPGLLRCRLSRLSGPSLPSEHRPSLRFSEREPYRSRCSWVICAVRTVIWAISSAICLSWAAIVAASSAIWPSWVAIVAARSAVCPASMSIVATISAWSADSRPDTALSDRSASSASGGRPPSPNQRESSRPSFSTSRARPAASDKTAGLIRRPRRPSSPPSQPAARPGASPCTGGPSSPPSA